MARQTGLVRIGARWYVRVAIPTDIKDTYGKSVEKHSLNTSDHQEALKLLPQARANIQTKFEEHRRMLKVRAQPPLKELSKEEIRKVGVTYYAFLLREDEETRNDDAPSEGFYEGEELERPSKTFEEHEEDTEVSESVDRDYQRRGKVNPFYMDEAVEVLSWTGIRLEENSSCLKAVARELQAASIMATKAIKERNQGEIVETPAAELSPYSLAPPLSQARDEWFTEKMHTNAWREKTKDQYLVWVNHFLAVIGDRPIDQYTKADGRRFRDIIYKLPANIDKKPELRGLPIDTAARRAEKLGMKPMSLNNAHKVLRSVFSLWKWISKNYDETPPNPLDGVVRAKARTNARKEREPFTLQELKTIFNAPIYTGCKSLKKWKQPGDTVLRNSYRYWVPLISLFTGMRLGEVCQLYCNDIRKESDIYYFDINEDTPDKKVKNFPSFRAIPIHSELIKMGLMDHIEKRRKEGSPRLFPDLKIGKDGYYSSNASKHFKRFFEDIGVKHPKNGFHSFRHCFEDACFDSNISYEQTDNLQGHGAGGMKDRYGSGFYIKKQAEAMQKLKYRDLDLSHLHTDQQSTC